MEQESVARLMKAEMDAKKDVDDAKKGELLLRRPTARVHAKAGPGQRTTARTTPRGRGNAGDVRAVFTREHTAGLVHAWELGRTDRLSLSYFRDRKLRRSYRGGTVDMTPLGPFHPLCKN